MIFLRRVCPFKDNISWYNQSESILGTSLNVTDIICNACDEKSINTSNLMSPRKQKHGNTVSAYKSYGKRTCWICGWKCWFKHESREDKNKDIKNCLKTKKLWENYST